MKMSKQSSKGAHKGPSQKPAIQVKSDVVSCVLFRPLASPLYVVYECMCM